ncbi:hypothetical protein F441_21572 [Phytophthora nicotianae CJ01A1]|uniref:Uncharacterized protein n=3 Tax=Phytophthora nicotianae TaxID=4792 RepID=W2ZHI6_PHYNI|nr:hypothetical protein F444_02760 [Phytophthora nicotianae P1976]ETP01140.1 hypothetical protein F441_21572 [Phytophthora nicotianae CJ01A1]ETP29288.1 hypothetical protein F442_21540 [Phytophthora nicotianae P10297]ETP45659.1 hypothetical protein F442_07958 [Phytophthora nicotianae P10297]
MIEAFHSSCKISQHSNRQQLRNYWLHPKKD